MSKDGGFFKRRWRSQHPHLRVIGSREAKSETDATRSPSREDAGEERANRRNKATALDCAARQSIEALYITPGRGQQSSDVRGRLPNEPKLFRDLLEFL